MLLVVLSEKDHMDRVIQTIREYAKKNADKIKAVVLFGSYNETNPNDLDYLVVLRDGISFYYPDELARRVFLETGTISDISCMHESEVDGNLEKDFLLYDIIHSGETIHDDGIIKRLKNRKVSFDNALDEMLKSRQEKIQILKESLLENLSIMLYAGYADHIYRKTGKVPTKNEVDLDLAKELNILKKSSLSFSEIQDLENKVYKVLDNLKSHS